MKYVAVEGRSGYLEESQVDEKIYAAFSSRTQMVFVSSQSGDIALLEGGIHGSAIPNAEFNLHHSWVMRA